MLNTLVNTLRNKAGRALNLFSPPQRECFANPAGTQKNVVLVCNRWEYGSRFNFNGFEYKRFIPGLREISRNVSFIPLEDINRIVKGVRDCSATGAGIVVSVFQRLQEIPKGYFDLRKDGYTLLNWYTDDDMQFEVLSRHIAREFDLNVTTFEPAVQAYKELDSKVFLSQWAGIEALPFREQRKYLACFVGRMYNQRAALFDRVKAEFKDLVYIHDTRKGPIPEDEMVEAYQNSWISIDEPTSSDRNNLQIKARVFETASMGCVVATKPIPAVSRYFVPGKEILFWRDEDELIQILRFCESSPDSFRQLARAAYDRVYREHMYTHRFKGIFSSLV
ncbi:MAG: glycosyltransferase [Elusimicrobiales bacterium]|nr:glycosyltransferase [Elusimicrobiales bacterium]